MSTVTDIKIYLKQWVAVATDNKVAVEFAWVVQRMILECSSCGQTLTSDIPKDTNVDYSIQEFVKIHAHRGSHHSGCSCVDCTKTVPMKPIPVTADFKKLEAKTEVLPFYSGGQAPIFDYGEMTNLPKAAKTTLDNVIPPLSDKDASKLAKQLDKFKKEYAEKQEEQFEKIKALQLQDSLLTEQKLDTSIQSATLSKEVDKAVAGWKTDWEAVDAEVAEIKAAAKNAKKLAYLQSMLDNMGLKTVPKDTDIPTPEPAPKKVPVLKDVRGRKFR